MQVILPLVAVHCFVDLISDLLFHTHHLALPPQHLDQTLQTARQGVFIHDRLLILIAEQKIGGDVFAQKYRVIAGNDGEHHIFAQTGVHAQVFIKAAFQAAEQCFQTDGIIGLDPADRGRADRCQQKAAAAVQTQHLCTGLTLYQNLDQFIRDTKHLFDLGYYAISIQIFRRRLIGTHLFLGHQKNIGIVGHSPLHRSNAFRTAYLKVDQIVGKHHQTPQGDGWQVQLMTLHLYRNFFRHIQTSRLPLRCVGQRQFF